jgi:hypothetical protein
MNYIRARLVEHYVTHDPKLAAPQAEGPTKLA